VGYCAAIIVPNSDGLLSTGSRVCFGRLSRMATALGQLQAALPLHVQAIPARAADTAPELPADTRLPRPESLSSHRADLGVGNAVLTPLPTGTSPGRQAPGIPSQAWKTWNWM
jgi:hypothetical protein